MKFRWCKRLPVVALSSIAICLSLPKVCEAYVIALPKPPAVPPQFMLALHFKAGQPANAPNPNAEVPQTSSLIANIMRTALEDRLLTVWSMYPASVRGRVFGGTGGDPFRTFGGGW
jgi:hypothetical protein